jgi:hypothetical protein
MEHTQANSAKTSREAVPSIELWPAEKKPEVRGYCLRIQAQGGARQGTRTVGRNAGALVPVLEPLHIAQQRPGVGQQVVAEQDRLGVLQVGPARHGHAVVGLGLLHQRVDGGQHAAGDDPGVVAQEHPAQRGHLVVARPAGAELAAQLGSGALDQAALQRTVHVLIGFRRHVGARGDVLIQPGEGGEHAFQLGVVQQAGLVQHAGVRLGAGDVVAGQPPVEVRGLAQRRQGIGGAAGEPAAPQCACVCPRAHPNLALGLRPWAHLSFLLNHRFLLSCDADVAAGGNLGGHAPQFDEAARHGLVEGVAGVVGGEVEVVQRGLGAAAVDDGLAAVEHHADVAGDVLLGVLDEGVQGALERGEPLAVVNQLGPALANGGLEAGLLALDGDVLEVLVRGDQRHGTRVLRRFRGT